MFSTPATLQSTHPIKTIQTLDNFITNNSELLILINLIKILIINNKISTVRFVFII